jgi:hypothetical protein
MVVRARSRLLTAISLAAAMGAAPSRGQADCWMTDLAWNPVPELQIAVWIEDRDGRFIDTVFVTRATGSYGLGNRPGRQDFNSDFLWPYGRRENVLPVWAHRRGVTYPRLVFQDGDDSDLSHAIANSSAEPHYCRPFRTGDG